jgi:endonuclease/exonuclease/phosphatase family metal-dependent hydrolase
MFEIPANLKGTYTNAIKDKPFDQIAFLAKDIQTQMGLAKAGTFPFFDHVYREADWKTYQPKMTLNEYKQWRTFKMSDHLPLWVELFVDFGNAYLERKMQKPSA